MHYLSLHRHNDTDKAKCQNEAVLSYWATNMISNVVLLDFQLLIFLSSNVCIFLSEVFANSPFFISAEVAGALDGGLDFFFPFLFLFIILHFSIFR